MADNLKKKTVNGIIWSAFDRFSGQGAQFIIMLVMARLLAPKDYGVLGMIGIFIAVSDSLINSGFSQALIRKQNRTDVDCSTVFYFNLVVSVCLYAVLFILAPYVALFYDSLALCSIMRVQCLSLIINSWGVVQRALLTLDIDFKSQAEISIASIIGGGVVGIVLAYFGYGVWALVFQQLTIYTLGTSLLWVFSKWRPLWCFSWKSFHELFAFGSKMLASGLLDVLYVNMYVIVIGKLFSASSLGHYTRAKNFSELPSSSINGIIQRVAYPVLCKIQDEDDRLRAAYRKLLKLSAFIIFPLMVGLASVSKPFVIFIIGEKWVFCSELLQIICFSMMWYPVHSINLSLLEAKGRSDLFLRLEIVKKILGVCILLCTFRFGLVVMCYGSIVSSILCLIINTYYTGKLINMGFLKQMCDLLPTFLVCMCMFGLILFINSFVSSYTAQLFIGIATGVVFFLSITYLFRFKELRELLLLIRKNNYRQS